MSFFMAPFYDKCMAATEDACLREWREELLSKVSGDVLELGAGTGANISFYTRAVNKLIVSEPYRSMR